MSALRKVIIANDFAFVNGGQAQVSIDSSLTLAAQGYEVTFFAAVGPVDERLKASRIEVVCLGQHDILGNPDRMQAMSQGVWNRDVLRELAKICQSSDPSSTVLHAHGFSKALSPSIGPLLVDGPLPAVYTMHEFFLACPNGGFFDYRRNRICTRRALGLSCLATNCDARSMSHKTWRVLRQVALHRRGHLPQGLSDVIYISEHQRRIMAPYISPNTRLHHVPNPVPDAGAPVDCRKNGDYVYIGRLSKEKGAAVFAEAAKSAGAQAVFVGSGPEESTIRQLNPGAELTGWLSREGVSERLSRARCLVFPSVWYETFGLVVYEALQRKVPVICGSWTAAAEAVDPGKTGLLVDEPGVEPLAAALRAMQDDGHPVFRGIAGRTAAAVSPDDHLRTLVSVYESLLKKEGRAAA